MDVFWREIKQKCGEMEARTKQPQSGDLLKTVIKVMGGPKTLTIRKKGGGGGGSGGGGCTSGPVG